MVIISDEEVSRGDMSTVLDVVDCCIMFIVIMESALIVILEKVLLLLLLRWCLLR